MGRAQADAMQMHLAEASVTGQYGRSTAQHGAVQRSARAMTKMEKARK